MSNVEDQVADIRERVARIEAQLSHLMMCFNRQKDSGGSVVIPVAAVITILEVVKVAIERLT